MTFGDRVYTESDPIAHYVGHPNAPVQASMAAVLRAAYFHGQQNARAILHQGCGFNTRDFTAEASTQRTILAGASGYVGIARGYRRLPPGQNVLVAVVAAAPRSVNRIQVAYRFSCYSIADDATDLDEYSIERNSDRTGLGRFQGANGWIANHNNRAAAVAGSVDNPFTAGFPVYVDALELPLVNVPTTGGTRVRILVEMRANQLSAPPSSAFNVAIHVQPVAVSVYGGARR